MRFGVISLFVSRRNEPFVPAFKLPSDGDEAIVACLETIHREGGGGGAPGAMLSAGNLNTAALTLFMALHLSVKSRLPWLVFDDPVQSMDEVHVQQFAALLRTLSKGHGKQVVIAVHDRPLFDYLELELSPAFPDDQLITVELGQSQGRAVAEPRFIGWSPSCPGCNGLGWQDICINAVTGRAGHRRRVEDSRGHRVLLPLGRALGGSFVFRTGNRRRCALGRRLRPCPAPSNCDHSPGRHALVLNGGKWVRPDVDISGYEPLNPVTGLGAHHEVWPARPSRLDVPEQAPGRNSGDVFIGMREGPPSHAVVVVHHHEIADVQPPTSESLFGQAVDYVVGPLDLGAAVNAVAWRVSPLQFPQECIAPRITRQSHQGDSTQHPYRRGNLGPFEHWVEAPNRGDGPVDPQIESIPC